MKVFCVGGKLIYEGELVKTIDEVESLRQENVEVNGLTVKINGVVYTVPDVARIVDEVESLRKENVALNKDRSALQNINEGLQKQVYNYQDVIANNLTGIRCKELEVKLENSNKIVEDQKKGLYGQFREIVELRAKVAFLEEIIRDDVGVESDEINSLRTEIDQLEECYKELLDINHAKHAQLQGQQAFVECLENDIKRLVKLNSKLINEREELQNQFDTYKKGVYFSTYSVR